jgi:diacylglycerol kinase (ATP)
VATVAVVATGLYIGIAAGHWRWIILSVALVLVAEALNSAVERLGDAVTTDRSPYVGYAKDFAGAAVLVAVVAALLIWLTIFIPYLRR